MTQVELTSSFPPSPGGTTCNSLGRQSQMTRPLSYSPKGTAGAIAPFDAIDDRFG